jgi:hypothetical protein
VMPSTPESTQKTRLVRVFCFPASLHRMSYV